jgi:16S rRNA (cytosine967-C5)-methyltransferase
MNLRAVAASVLDRITRKGAYSNVLIPRATSNMTASDRAFVTGAVHGALRRLRHIDGLIADLSGRDVDRLDHEVRAVLEVALAEVLDTSARSIHATVNEAVEAVRELGKGRAAGFVNAVLRRLTREGIPDEPASPGMRFSVPDWLVSALSAAHGSAETVELLAGLRKPGPRTPIRLRPGTTPPEGADPVDGIEGAFYCEPPVAEQTGVVFADAASTAVGLAVAPQPGMVILDMAAAPGGKTMHISDQVGGDALIVAMDVHHRRLHSAERRLRREQVAASWTVADGRRTPFREGVFDAVLLDAPCTGLGTLRRRPEIAMRLDPGSPRRLAVMQKQMLSEAWRVARAGARIVYSVCTLFAEETIDMVSGYPAAPPDRMPGRSWGKGLLLAPHTTGTDGMFISVITR